MVRRHQKNGKATPRAPAARPFGVFRPKERLIYSYWDGERNRKGDPLELLRRLNGYEGLALKEDAQLAFGSTPEAPRALGRLVGAVREIFGVKRLDDGGLAEAECLGLLVQFLQFITEVQSDAAPLPSSAPPTAGPEAPSTTAASRDSGSTGSGS